MEEDDDDMDVGEDIPQTMLNKEELVRDRMTKVLPGHEETLAPSSDEKKRGRERERGETHYIPPLPSSSTRSDVFRFSPTFSSFPSLSRFDRLVFVRAITSL